LPSFGVKSLPSKIKRDELLAKAKEAEGMAAKAMDIRFRDVWLSIAIAYRELGKGGSAD